MEKIKHVLYWFKVNSLTYCLGYIFRTLFINRIERSKLKNRNFSVLSQNCVGCVMLHDLGQPFNSPTVNLYMSSPDYIIFLERLTEFIGQKLTFVESDKRYPKGILFYDADGEKKSISLYFPHDNDTGKIQNDWLRRSERVHYDNLYVIATDRDGLTMDILERFSMLPYKHKVLLSSKPYPEFSFVQYFKQYKNLDQLTSMVDIVSIFGKREYGQGWDYVSWLNS